MNPHDERRFSVEADPNVIIVVDRVEPDTEPDYCIHGRTKCVRCQHWCWLSAAALTVVSAGNASPWCLECAVLAELGPDQYVGRLETD